MYGHAESKRDDYFLLLVVATFLGHFYWAAYTSARSSTPAAVVYVVALVMTVTLVSVFDQVRVKNIPGCVIGFGLWLFCLLTVP